MGTALLEEVCGNFKENLDNNDEVHRVLFDLNVEKSPDLNPEDYSYMFSELVNKYGREYSLISYNIDENKGSGIFNFFKNPERLIKELRDTIYVSNIRYQHIIKNNENNNLRGIMEFFDFGGVVTLSDFEISFSDSRRQINNSLPSYSAGEGI